MINNQKIISAVIPFYGDPSDSLKLIDELKKQSIFEQVEIIVSDDCSPNPFPKVDGVKVVRRDRNGGFGSNVNTGALAASGKWLFILNSDLSLQPDFMEKALAKAETLGDVLFSPQVLGHDGKGQWVGRKFPKTFHFAWEWFIPLSKFKDTDFWHKFVGHDLSCKTGKTVKTDWVMGACMIIQRETYLRVGMMDERFFMNSEEVDLQRRLRDINVPRYFAGDLSVEHVGGASSGGSLQRRQWLLDSRYIYAKKWGEDKGLSTVLRAVTYLNYVFNRMRQIRNKDIDAKEYKNDELKLISSAEKKVR